MLILDNQDRLKNPLLSSQTAVMIVKGSFSIIEIALIRMLLYYFFSVKNNKNVESVFRRQSTFFQMQDFGPFFDLKELD